MKKHKRKKNVIGFGLLFWVGFIFLMCFLFYLNRTSISKTITKINGVPSTTKVASEIQNRNIIKEIEKKSHVEHLEDIEETFVNEIQKVQNKRYKELNNFLNNNENIQVPSEDKGNVNLLDRPNIEKEKDNNKKKEAETRLVDVYFVSINSSGAITREKCSRSIEKTTSPMKDSLNVLLEGTTKEEAKKGIRSFIPADTKLLSASIKEGTAVINLSEDFQFNRYGVEGYNIQLQQIVFTACSFKNVEKVQFLIEGQKRDFLGSEGIWIGSPLNMNSF